MKRVLAAAALLAFSGSAHAQEGTLPPVVGPGDVFSTIRPDAEIGKNCPINDVAVFERRVHIRCGPRSSGGPFGSLQPGGRRTPNDDLAGRILYFAVDVRADAGLADRVIALATADAAGRQNVTVFFRSDPAENPPGCLPADCRRLTGLVVPIQP